MIPNFHINCHRCNRSFYSNKPPENCHDLVCKYYTPNDLGLNKHPIVIIEEAELAKKRRPSIHIGKDYNNEVLIEDKKKMTYPRGAMVDEFHPDDKEYEPYQSGQRWDGTGWV